MRTMKDITNALEGTGVKIRKFDKGIKVIYLGKNYNHEIIEVKTIKEIVMVLKEKGVIK